MVHRKSFKVLFYSWVVLLNLFFGKADFTVMPIGTQGGSLQAGCSSFLLSCPGNNQNKYIALDGGTILDGLKIAADKGNLDCILNMDKYKEQSLTKENFFLAEQLTGYFVSHAHLDHVSGLIISSPDEKVGGRKPIISRNQVIDIFKDHLFNFKVWDDFTKYGFFRFMGLNLTTISMSPVALDADCPGLEISNAFPLSHPSPSTAFLLRSSVSDKYVLFFGDTGPDEVEKSTNLESVWNAIAPLINNNKLLVIIIEVSYPDPRDSSKLYGHLSPEWLNKELESLSRIVSDQGGDPKLTNLNVIVSHIKVSSMRDKDPPSIIHRQLQQYQDQTERKVNFIIPQVGKLLHFGDGKNFSTCTKNTSKKNTKFDFGVIVQLHLSLMVITQLF